MAFETFFLLFATAKSWDLAVANNAVNVEVVFAPRVTRILFLKKATPWPTRYTARIVRDNFGSLWRNPFD